MSNFHHSTVSWAAKLSVGTGLAFALVSAWSAGPRDTGQLAIGATVVDQCVVGNPEGGKTAWACTSGTTATLAFGLGAESSGAYRRLASTTASVSAAPAADDSSGIVRLTILFAP
jgi:hypothetical protein